jgi:hypothetical protein
VSTSLCGCRGDFEVSRVVATQPLTFCTNVLGPVWIRGIYAKIVFSPKYIFAKVGVVWIRGIFDRLAAQDQSDVAQNQARKYMVFSLQNIFWRKYYFRINTANPDRPLTGCRLRPVFTLVGPGEISVGVQSSVRNTHIISFVHSKYHLFCSWLFLD